MNVFRLPGGEDCALPAGCFMALGCFDGVHVGHAALLRAGAESAAKRGAPLAVWSPTGAKSAPQILQPALKREKLAAAGAMFYAEEDFKKIKALSPRAFFEEYLIGRCRVSALACGENFTFGKDAGGNCGTLAGLCAEKGVFLYVQPSVRENGGIVSSAAIREALAGGEIARANALLGEAFCFRANVMPGRGIGKTIGFPTLNLPLPEGFLPPNGVYAARASVRTADGTFFKDLAAVVNVGVHPTFEKAEKPLCEVHLLSATTAGANISVCAVRLFKRLRAETAFSSVDELTAQIAKDIEETKRLLCEAR